MDIIKIIRAEIERLKEENNNIKCKYNEKYCIGYDDAFNDLLSFLDTLQEQEVKEQKSQDTVGRVSVEIRSNLQTDEVVRKTLIMLVNDGRISVTGAITSSDILNWLEGQKVPEVDLEKEIDKTVYECTDGYNFDWDKFARHFYNLGLKNAK